GFTFCPTNNKIDEFRLHCDLSNFARTLRLKENFGNNSNYNTNDLRNESRYTPPLGRNHNLDLYIESVIHDVLIHSSQTKRTQSNLTKNEKTALDSLLKRQDLDIREADKGGGIVVRKQTEYVQEALLQLSNTRNYKRLTGDPTLSYIK